MGKPTYSKVSGKVTGYETAPLFSGHEQDPRKPTVFATLRIKTDEGNMEMRHYIATNRIRDVIEDAEAVTVYAVKKGGKNNLGLIYAADAKDGNRVEDIDQLMKVCTKMVRAKLMFGMGWLWWFLGCVFMAWVPGGSGEDPQFALIKGMFTFFAILLGLVMVRIWMKWTFDPYELRKTLEGDFEAKDMEQTKVI